MRSVLLIGLLLCSVVLVARAGDPSFDHQTTTYTSTYHPVTEEGSLTVTPFFSPDHSSGVQTSVVESAQVSIDIGAPSWSSWIESCSTGCSPTELRKYETFPVWQALLNALHNGIRVRIMINNYDSTGPSTGDIDPLTFLYLNGADIRYFTTLTFLHTKYIATESMMSISSVNFDEVSYLENREAGVVISGDSSGPLRALMNETFNSDFAIATPFKPNQYYSSSEYQIITNPDPIPVVIPPRPNIDAYDTPLINVTGDLDVTVFDSPDFAYNLIAPYIQNAQKSIQVMMYQITDIMCDLIGNVSSNIQTTLLVSSRIDSSGDNEAAQACYKQLTDAGFTVRLTSEVFQYSHQKFWIIDEGLSEAVMFLSTGNWGSSDFPNGSDVFPPYSSSSWRDTNRDFSVMMNDPTIISIFAEVISKDYAIGTNWSPSKSQ
eukprot:TRINITY_DN3459_c0_g1_i1.p1 TRINITY_DN3459_c0_g1~~TRINITY_DN3459_c0_g1_i1.p1  ORF type:complete len:433 (-),score=89.55 TRINITY_DN3459_c0_g1_i1:136-1434(-)